MSDFALVMGPKAIVATSAANQLGESFSRLIQPSLRHKRRNGTSYAPNILPYSMEDDTTEESLSEGRDREQLLQMRRGFSSFPFDIQDFILAILEWEDLFQTKAVSKFFKDRIESDEFHSWRGAMHPSEGSLTALHFFLQDPGVWQCVGYDLTANIWRRLPPFEMLPPLDPALFKDYSICGAGAIMCAYVSTSSMKEKMIVFNPLTRRWRELPPLNHPRNLVLMHMVVDSGRDSYKIIVAGSARAGHEHLQKITEVFDSRTSMWTVTQDLPDPLYALNEHQTGVYTNGILYCIAFLEGSENGLGLLAYSVDEGKWLPHLTCPLPNPTNLNMVQLVETLSGEVILFSETAEHNGNVEHRIDKLEIVLHIDPADTDTCKWINVMREVKVGSLAGLQVYPEYTCVPFGEGKLCIFNTIADVTGIVYDIHSGQRIGSLPSPTCNGSGDMGFLSMNPLPFSFEPSFKGNYNLNCK